MVLYRHCAILGCKDKTSTRHRFPNPKKDKNRYDECIRICGNAKLVTLNPATVYLSQRVCHIHFQKSDYASNMYIKRTSLPTLHIPNNTNILHEPIPDVTLNIPPMEDIILIPSTSKEIITTSTSTADSDTTLLRSVDVTRSVHLTPKAKPSKGSIISKCE
ncbi:hypothetical protein RN001_005732 [Aquatica leii]|uniref:THAP-type domain-containing protein n=1 Tax=Aquatica leii TaxID=1421715 RepID=A0AAN7PD41_9COLE|nr:hypothetical protein RN001_005732 [Aquatica leii]